MNSENKNLFIAIGATAILGIVVFLAMKVFAPKSSPESLAPKVETIATADWVRGLRGIIAVGVCAEPGYFTSCYEFKESSCADTMIRLAMDCFEEKKSDMPTVLRLPRDGQFWGRQLSICAVKGAEAKLANTKHSSKDCKDIGIWTEKNPAPKMTKARYMFSAEFDLPVRFCDPKGPVRACFVMDDQECSGLLQGLVSECLQTLDPEIPGDLSIPQDTLIWGTRIGKCVGDILESKHAAKKTGDCRALTR